MKYSEAKQGRVFIIRLEDGDLIREKIEEFANKKSISCATMIIHGGIDENNTLIVGPKEARSETIQPMKYTLAAPHEVIGTGTLFPDEKNKPTLHMHLASGREKSALVGCVRQGVKTWHVLEIILTELLDCNASRVFNSQVGLGLLHP